MSTSVNLVGVLHCSELRLHKEQLKLCMACLMMQDYLILVLVYIFVQLSNLDSFQIKWMPIYCLGSTFLLVCFTDGCVSSVAWKLNYYQWAMQTFEQYGISEGAYQFALAALEQVDEALTQKDESSGRDMLNESANTIKGRLWANVFKFTLDLNHINDAYCAILSNPDEESKYICLRRFIIVLYERGGIKVFVSPHFLLYCFIRIFFHLPLEIIKRALCPMPFGTTVDFHFGGIICLNIKELSESIW